MMRPVWLILLSLFALAVHATAIRAADEPANAEATKFFETKVRPILVERCYKCHGPESKPEGNLRLDSLAAMLKGGDIGPAIKPGDPKGSLLIDAINHGDVVQMPPKNKMPAAEIAALTAWVAGGAAWPDAPTPAPLQAPAIGTAPISAEQRSFWAFQPPADPPAPAVRDTAWPKGVLDRFVLTQLEAKNLTPAAPADKRTLIRRATFDLHGLPPTPEEVTAFLADDTPDAFAKVVDRLLTSPRYGERWGRHWLDIARYADSNGMDENMAMAHAWRYRDYVVKAFNKDLPYDQFIREQLAGDLLPSSDDQSAYERLTATGFLVLGPKMLAEDDPVKMEMDIVDEQVDTIGRAFMGLTLGCARCHDHKFDPIPTADYYSLAGIFKSTKSMENYRVVAMWSERPLASGEQLAQCSAQKEKLATVMRDIVSLEKKARDRVHDDSREKIVSYLLATASADSHQQLLAEMNAGALPPGVVVVEAEQFARGNVQRDQAVYGAGIGVILNAGPMPNVAEYDVDVPSAGTYQLALRYAAVESRPVVVTVNGRAVKADAASKTTGSWNPDTQAWSIELSLPLAAGRHTIRLEREGAMPHVDKLALLPAQFTQDPITGAWRVVGEMINRDLNAKLFDQWSDYLKRTKSEPQSVMRLWHVWRQNAGQPPAAEGPVETALLRAPRPTTLADLAQRYAELFRAAETASTEQQKVPDSQPTLADPALEAFRLVLIDDAGPLTLKEPLDRYYAPESKTALANLREEQKQIENQIDSVPHALAAADRTPQNLKVHIRGNHLTQGAETPRQFPRVLAGETQQPIGEKTSGRLELANWLAGADHPLTSRVMVNRIWQGHFGQGLVRSPDNFGRLGEGPDNQPLLDWLARRFVESGWSVKAMHRLIMLTSAYQMSTTYRESAAQADPENRLLWRMNRRRLEAEEIRDALLATSGQLELSMGGTLLKNKNHTYVTSTASANDVNYQNHRRSIYLPVVRSAVYEVFQAFDFADPSTMSGRRPSTTVAPQALFMMNSSLALEQSRALAEMLIALAIVDDPARVTAAYERIYSRPPTPAETTRALDFVARYQTELTSQKNEPVEARLGAWQALCRVLYASNEFVYLE